MASDFLKVDTSAFNSMVSQLASKSASSFASALKLEVARVLEKASKTTRAADGKKIRATVDKTAAAPTTKKRLLRAKLGAKGISKKTWSDLAASIGASIKVPGYVTKAKPSNGKDYGTQVSSRSGGTGPLYSIQIENHQPTVVGPGIDGAKVLSMAIAGRIKFFEGNLKRKLFDDLGKTAERYPGVKATT
jgi:hypothetical protein